MLLDGINTLVMKKARTHYVCVATLKDGVVILSIERRTYTREDAAYLFSEELRDLKEENNGAEIGVKYVF